MVNSGIEACVSVTPTRKGGRAYYRGTVKLADARFVIHQSGVDRAQAEQVRNVHAWCVGDVVEESDVQETLTEEDLADFVQVTYHFNVGRFFTVGPEDLRTDVTDLAFSRAIFVGRDFYVKA